MWRSEEAKANPQPLKTIKFYMNSNFNKDSIAYFYV